MPAKASEQHYEVPAAFFGGVLGPHRKYSSCYWPGHAATLHYQRTAEAWLDSHYLFEKRP